MADKKHLLILAPLFLSLLSHDKIVNIAYGEDNINFNQQIYIEAKGQTLEEVLNQIQNESGIQFSLPKIFKTDFITTTLSGVNWLAAIRELLSTYNTVEIWDENQLIRVVILERGESPKLAQDLKHTVDTHEHSIHGYEDTNSPVVPPASYLPLPTTPPLPPPPAHSQF